MKIRFEPINENNYLIAADCLSYMFFNYEPVTSHLGLEWESYKNMVQRFCKVIGKNGLCFVAIDEEKEIACGVNTTIDLMIDFGKEFENEPGNFDDVLEKLAPDMAMTHELAEPFMERKEYSKGECINFFQCAVLPKYSGAGIATQLVRLTLEEAQKRGYSQAIVSCTSGRSKSIFDKLGYEVVNSINYSDFEFEGERFFRDVPGEYVLLAGKI